MTRAERSLPTSQSQRFPRSERLSLAAMALMMLVLATAGGASHPDVPAQIVARGGAAIVLCLLIGFAPPLAPLRYRAIWLFLAALAGLVLAQLIPLPQSVWASLPGHAPIAERLRELDLPRPPRPINLVPDKGLNTLFALIVPAAMLATLSCLGPRGEAILRPSLILLALGSAVVGLLQATGAFGQGWLMNVNSANYSGFCANRNHQALLLSIGIAAALFWGLERELNFRRPRLWLALAATIILAQSIMLTGSRVGMVLGLAAMMWGLAWGGAARARERQRRRYVGPLLGLVVGMALLGLAIYLRRASAFDRMVGLSSEEDIRLRAIGTVWELVKAYFPFGSGFGSFDAVFRVVEPIDLLGDKYLNHAHNDVLEFLLEGGAGAACLLGVAIVWVARRSRAALEDLGGSDARLGLIIITLIGAASMFDYPLRTPLMMAIAVIASCWLARAQAVR